MRSIIFRHKKDLIKNQIFDLYVFSESGFTFVFPGDTKKYSSLTEFAESENFDILLPEWLPENVKIENIIYTKSEQYEKINFQFSIQNLFYSVKLNQIIEYDTWDAIEQGSFNDITYYVLESEYGFEVCFTYQNDSYSIIYSDISTVINILENLKIQE